MTIPNWVFALRDANVYRRGKGQTFSGQQLLYETYGLLVPVPDIANKQIHLRELQPIELINGGFREDTELEKTVYEQVVRPYLRTRNSDSVFMQVGSESICEMLQKQKAIDILTDNGSKNATISIKAVRSKFRRIFWEYEKNSNTHEAGWGLYSEATWHFYLMAEGNGMWLCIMFKNTDLREKLKMQGEALQVEKQPGTKDEWEWDDDRPF